MNFIAGLSDATGLLSHECRLCCCVARHENIFLQGGRRPYYNDEFVLEIDTLNGITSGEELAQGPFGPKKESKISGSAHEP